MPHLIFLLVIISSGINLGLTLKANAQFSDLYPESLISPANLGIDDASDTDTVEAISANVPVFPDDRPATARITKLVSPIPLSDAKRFEISQGASNAVGDTFNSNDVDQLRQDLLIEPITRKKTVFPPTPGSTLGIPTAFGANWGNAFIGAGLTSDSPPTRNEADGSVSLGMGFWNSQEAVGIEVDLGISNLQGNSVGGNSGSDGQIGIKIHRLLDTEKGNWAIAVGWENAIRWGENGDSVFASDKDSFYGVVTGRIELQPTNPDNKLPLTVSLGVGNGRFGFNSLRNPDEQSVGVFSSVGLRIFPPVSLITTWTGQELNMGVSLAPFYQQDIPLIINLGAADVTDVFPTSTRFFMTAGYGFRF